MVVSLIEVDPKVLKNLLEEKMIKDLESSKDTNLKLRLNLYQLEQD